MGIRACRHRGHTQVVKGKSLQKKGVLKTLVGRPKTQKEPCENKRGRSKAPKNDGYAGEKTCGGKKNEHR